MTTPDTLFTANAPCWFRLDDTGEWRPGLFVRIDPDDGAGIIRTLDVVEGNLVSQEVRLGVRVRLVNAEHPAPPMVRRSAVEALRRACWALVDAAARRDPPQVDPTAAVVEARLVDGLLDALGSREAGE